MLDNSAFVLRRRKLGKARIVIPSKTEFEKLVATLRRLDVRCRDAADLIEPLAYSGMRLAEATSIVWGDVDFKAGRFTVTGGELGTKNHEARVVPLFPAMRAYLERMRSTREIASDALIIGIGKATKALDHACEVAALPRFTHHCMRHYFVSNAIETGSTSRPSLPGSATTMEASSSPRPTATSGTPIPLRWQSG